MNLENEYEKRFGEFPLHNITIYLIGGQILMYVLGYIYPGFAQTIHLQWRSLLAGQWWRIGTFLFVPFAQAPLWIALAWYFMYIVGTSLEAIWGSFRYALYLAISIIATIISALLFPHMSFGNGFIFSSLFLAFAYVNPDFQLLILFVIPVKIKWIGLLTWIGLGFTFVLGDMATRIQTLLAIGNFILFFGEHIVRNMSDRTRRGGTGLSKLISKQKTYMKCAVCGATERDPKIFYYCHTCVPDTCYCEDHIHTHTHKGTVSRFRTS